MERIRVIDKDFELFITDDQIQEAVNVLAQRIMADAEGRNPLFVGVLNGAFMFVSDMMRVLNRNVELTFARYTSYSGTSSTGQIREVMPVQTDVRNRWVILLEDIVDTGFTMKYVKEKLYQQGAAEVRLATMLYKPESIKCDIRPDYYALQIPPDFIIGHGLDYNGCGRAFRDIYKVI